MTNKYLLIKVAAILLLIIGFQQVLSGTVADIRFRNIQTQNGISSNDVNCIFKDSHGFMWFGTASGLNRYDGYSVKIYHSQRPDTTALRDNYIQDIQEDAEGKLWLYAGGTYSIYNPVNDKFQWFGHNEAQQLGLPAEPKLVMIHDDTKWFVVNDKSLYKSDNNQKATKVSEIKSSCSITDIIAIPTSNNKLLAITDGGELFFIGDKGKIITQTMVPSVHVRHIDFSLFTDHEGLVWVYSVLGVSCFNPQTKQWISRKICQDLNGVSVKSIAQDDLGKIWIGTDNHGIYIVDKDDLIDRLTNISSDMYSLSNNTVKTLFNSGDGGMWVGTYKKGVSVYYPSEYKFLSRPIADVNCMTRNPNEYSSVWVGTDHSGLMKYNYSTHEITKIEDAEDTGHHSITSMMTDSNGALWIGTYQGGLKRYSNGKFEHWTTQTGLSSNNIWAILEGNDGKIWLGTLDGGLQIYNPATKSFKTLDITNSKINSNFINTLAKGRDGQIFAGTTYGIARISPSDYTITTYRGSYKDEKNFSNLNINQIAVDSKGLVWVGTREGLEVYDVKNDTLYNISLSDRFPNPFILGITEGADHSMWVTVSNEIFNISVTTENQTKKYAFDVKSYGHHDGTVSGTFNQRSMCLLPSGELLAGSVEGIVTVNPEKITLNTNRPHVIFTGLAIKNIPVEVGKEYKGKVILSGALDYIDKVKLDYDNNDLTVYFTTDNYSNLEHTVYKYKLEGFDNEWITCATGMHHATYTNLPPGKYTLHVIATNSDGFESETASKIKIEISAPWWWTW